MKATAVRTAVRHGLGSRDCHVLHCTDRALTTWSKSPWEPDLATWPVCLYHYARLGAGEAWTATRVRFPPFGRKILMGNDLLAWRQPSR